MDDYTTILNLSFLPLLIFFRVWYSLGGWPEAWYRLRRVDYFVQFIREASGKITRHVHKWDKIRRNSPAMFSFKGGDWLVDEDLQSRSNGRPAWFYNYNDARPIPMGVDKLRCDPVLIQKGFRNKTIGDIHRTGEDKKPKDKLWLAIILIALVGMTIYSVYLGYNIYCGQAPARCR